MRNVNKSENIKPIAAKENPPIRITKLDVTDDVSINNAVQAILSETGRIDVLVNNAGYVLDGAFEDLSMNEIKSQYETNVFGLIRKTQAILPTMRKQKSGIIMNMNLHSETLRDIIAQEQDHEIDLRDALGLR
jgi:NADP-dependent 3-hydroxy acid dehydrogenase YdfG